MPDPPATVTERARESSPADAAAAPTSSDIPRSPSAALPDSVRTDFALVIPAYNEAPAVPALIRELRSAFERHGLRGEVVLVDDGSTDGTAAAAEREGKGWELLRIVRHRTNRGKTEALVTGSQSTEREYVVLFDADLQHAPDEIPRFLAKLEEGWDIVTARKVGAYAKKAVSTVYNSLSRKIFRVPVSDLNSMKAFRRSILDEVQLRHDWHRFFVVLAHARGYSVTEIDVELLPRVAGEPKYQGRFRIVIGLMDMISVWFLLLFSRKPLILFGFSGLVLIVLGLLVGVVSFYLRFMHPMLGFDPFIPPMGYRPLLYLVILLETVGFLLFGFGLVAELIAQLRAEVDALARGSR